MPKTYAFRPTQSRYLHKRAVFVIKHEDGGHTLQPFCEQWYLHRHLMHRIGYSCYKQNHRAAKDRKSYVSRCSLCVVVRTSNTNRSGRARRSMSPSYEFNSSTFGKDPTRTSGKQGKDSRDSSVHTSSLSGVSFWRALILSKVITSRSKLITALRTSS